MCNGCGGCGYSSGAGSSASYMSGCGSDSASYTPSTSMGYEASTSSYDSSSSQELYQ
ncbi:hypothetical protein HOC35_05150 [Candidatus Woesearchaeota archaeon]|jgi:hypothetical protein|nr:hypothetical protein [Candidatus Woesearchaeota archaeon]